MASGGVERGKFRPVANDSLVWSLMATYDGLAAYATFVPTLDLRHICGAFIDVVLTGLSADSAQDRPRRGA